METAPVPAPQDLKEPVAPQQLFARLRRLTDQYGNNFGGIRGPNYIIYPYLYDPSEAQTYNRNPHPTYIDLKISKAVGRDRVYSLLFPPEKIKEVGHFIVKEDGGILVVSTGEEILPPDPEIVVIEKSDPNLLADPNASAKLAEGLSTFLDRELVPRFRSRSPVRRALHSVRNFASPYVEIPSTGK